MKQRVVVDRTFSISNQIYLGFMPEYFCIQITSETEPDQQINLISPEAAHEIHEQLDKLFKCMDKCDIGEIDPKGSKK